MRRTPLLAASTRSILSFAVFAAMSAGAAAADAESVWLKPVVEAPVGARAPITVSLEPAQTQCRAAYGNDWQQRCSIALGRPGTLAQGVLLTPDIPGTWRWIGPRTLAFEPKNDWEPGRRLRLSLAALPIPLRASLEGSFASLETPPLTQLSAQTRVMIDPVRKDKRAATFEFTFTTSVKPEERKKIESAAKLKGPTGSKLKLGKAKFIWSDDGAGLYVSVPIIELGADPAALTLELPGIAAKFSLKDGRFSVPKGFEAAKATAALPGLTTLFQISEASAEPARDDLLNSEYEITLASSLALPPEKLLKSLTVLALPQKFAADAASSTVWTKLPVIDDEALSRAKPLKAEFDADSSSPNRVKLRLKAEPGSYLYLALPQGFGPEGTPGLSQPWHSVLALPAPSAEIAFLQPGNMLTLAGNWELSLYSSGADAIKWRIARIRDEFLALAADGWSSMTREAPDGWLTAKTGEISLGAVDPKAPGRSRFTTLDLSEAVIASGPGLYQIELVATRMKDGKPLEVARAAKRVLVTNIAMIAKSSADGALDLFAANFADGKPAAGLKASLIARNGSVLASTQTDESGRAHFDSTKGWSREREPVAAALRSKGTDLAWISLKDPGNIAYARDWDTGGRLSGASGLSALAFADRGIYRPGETVHFGMMLRTRSFETLPEGTPIEARLTNDAGKTLLRSTVKLSAEGLSALDWTIPAHEPPGRLRLDLFAESDDNAERQSLFTTSVYVGDFTPETLSLSASVLKEDHESGWLKPRDIALQAELKSLFGAGAQGRRISGEIRIEPLASVDLPGLKGWTFSSPAQALSRQPAAARTLSIPETATPGSGKVELKLPLSQVSLSGFNRVEVDLTGTEAEGGSAVGTRKQFLVSPAELALGWKLEKTPQPSWFLITGEPAQMSLLALDSALKPRAGERLRVSIAKTRWVTELTEDPSGRLDYAETPVTEVRRTFELTTDTNGLAELDLITGEPGNWLVQVERENGELLLAAPYSTAGGALKDFAAGSLPTAELRATIEKSDLAQGETARISVLAPVSGFALATFEAAGVLSSRWIELKAGDNLLEIPAPQDYSGRAWLRLSLVRGQDDAKKFISGFAETALPVTIGMAQKRFELALKTPEKVSDARRIPVEISAPEKGFAFVWAADDGILSLTNWKTPDPIKSLLADRALEVQTRETLSLLMPDAGALKRLTESPAGGDMMERAAAALGFGNPFKRSAGPAAVWWGGLVEVGPEPKTIEMTLPEGFSGRVRVSALGANTALAGSSQAQTSVAPDLVVDPILPAAVSPGDTFRAGAVVTPAEASSSGTLTVKAPEGFAPQRSDLALQFPSEGGSSASAEFSVPEGEAALGAQRFTFAASARGAEAEFKTERSAEISVRPASVWASKLYVGRLENAEKSLVKIPSEIYPENASTRFAAAVTPAVIVKELGAPFEDLSDWSSIAARIAASLPDVLLSLNQDAAKLLPYSALTADPQAAKSQAEVEQKRRESVYRAVTEGISWRGLKPLPWAEADPFTGAMALDYLCDAQRLDPLALEPLGKLRAKLLSTLNTDPATLDDARTTAYTLWALTREGSIVTAQIEALRNSMTARFENWQRDAAAAFIAASYSRLKLHEEARQLASGIISTARASDAWTPETAAALAAAALSESGLGDTQAGRFLSNMAAEDLSRAFAAGVASPAYAAAAARAAMSPDIGGLKPAEAEGTAAPDLVCTARSSGFPQDQDRLVLSSWGAVLDAPGCTAVEVSGMPASSWIWWHAEQSGYERTAKGKTAAPQKFGLEVERVFLGSDGKPRTAFKSGERITVRVELKSFTSGKTLNDVAVSDLLPGGFSWAMPPGASPSGARESQRQEDRVDWIAPELANWNPLSFTYTVRAAYPGTFAVAPITARSISNPAIRAQGAAGTIVVTASDEGASSSPTATETPRTPETSRTDLGDRASGAPSQADSGAQGAQPQPATKAAP